MSSVASGPDASTSAEKNQRVKHTYKDLPNGTKIPFVTSFLPTFYLHIGTLHNPWLIEKDLHIIGTIWMALFPDITFSNYSKIIIDLVSHIFY